MTARLVLVRHGQASFGAKDYDRLSETGHRQARLAGKALSLRRPSIGRVVVGSMRRHQETAAGCLEGMGRAEPFETDPGWNEFDHEELIRVQEPRYRDHLVLHREMALAPDPEQAFLSLFRASFSRWVSGRHDGDYRESFAAFRSRVAEAARRAIDTAGSAAPSGAVLVVTSGGPIAAAVAARLGLPPLGLLRLAFRLANAGITTLTLSEEGLSVEELNDHRHLAGEPGLLTHR